MAYQYEPLSDEYLFQDFLVDLFNEKFNTNTFENYRSKGYAQYGVDAYSPALKIAVQAKKKDLSRSADAIEKELVADLEETIGKLKEFPHEVTTIYAASTTKKFPKVQDKAMELSNEKLSVQFYSWHDIQKEIPKFSSIREKYFPHLATKVYPKELVNTPRLHMNEIIGRKAELMDLKNLFIANKIVSIESIGGIGKTTFTRAYYQNNIPRYDHSVWIDYLTDFKKDIAFNDSLVSNLQLSFDDPENTERRYETVLSSLLSLKGKILIVIDNLQHQSDINVQIELQKFLANPGIHVLVSARQPFAAFATLYLPTLALQDARDLFRQLCTKRVTEEKLDHLLQLIDRNTLLIHLIAKTLMQAVELTIEQVIQQLTEYDLRGHELNIEIDHTLGNQFVQDKIYGQLKAAFNFSTLNNDEQVALHLMAIVPSTFVPIAEVLNFFNYKDDNRSKIVNAINNLHKKGWVQRGGDEVKMHRLLQDVVRIQVESYLIYLFILPGLLHVSNQANTTFSSSGYRLQVYAESILEKLKGPKAEGIFQPLSLLKNNLFLMYRYLGDFEKASVLIKDLIDNFSKIENHPSCDSDFIGTLSHNIGFYYMDNGDYDNAENYLKKAIDYYPVPPPAKIVNTYTALHSISEIKGDVAAAIEYVVKGMDALKEKNEEENDDLVASMFNTLAMLYFKMGDQPKAIAMIHEAIMTHRNSTYANKNPAVLAEIYANAAVIYVKGSVFDTAIQFALHAIKYREMLNLEADERLIELYWLAAKVYEDAGVQEKANQLRDNLRNLQ
jgi:tetratricopeptide (TPR) repeat protein